MREILLTFFLLAGVQGILLSVVLFSKKVNHRANIILSAACFALSLDLFAKIYYEKEMFLQYPHFIGITYPFPYFYGPFFYLYTKLISKHEQRLNIKHLIHFIPGIIVYAVGLPIYFSDAQGKLEFAIAMIANEGPFIFNIIDWIIPLQGIFYTVLTILVVVAYNKRLKDNFSNIDRINLNWLKYIAFGIIIIWSIVAFLYLSDFFIQRQARIDYMLQFSISILIYSIGYIGLTQPEVFLQHVDEITETDETKSGRYSKSGLDEISADDIKGRLLNLMENEKPYLDSELTLKKLSEILCVSGHHLSEVINTRLNQNYYDFINNYRVEEFKARIKDPAFSNYNLLSIAFDSGFKSKTAFNTIFKKLTGKTPSEYKASVVKQTE